MGRSQETFNKKEREKKRLKKQQDKQEKMKERKGNKEKGKGLEDMMAYLDENGNITSSPPDPRKKKTVKQEEIQIGVPKHDPNAQPERRSGIVTFFNDQKGFGFITDLQSRERIFVHASNLSVQIKENDKVSFEVESSHKGPVALNVTLTTNSN